MIRAAAHAFNHKGYHNTSLDDIAAALQVTKPTVYYYVTNKEQLLFECFVAGVEQIRAGFREAKSHALPARERLTAVLRNYAQAMASEFGWCMVRVEDQDLSPAMSSHVKAMKSEIDQGIRRLIREGVQDGSIHPCDPKMTAFALAGSLNWIAHWYRGKPVDDRRTDRGRVHNCIRQRAAAAARRPILTFRGFLPWQTMTL